MDYCCVSNFIQFLLDILYTMFPFLYIPCTLKIPLCTNYSLLNEDDNCSQNCINIKAWFLTEVSLKRKKILFSFGLLLMEWRSKFFFVWFVESLAKQKGSGSNVRSDQRRSVWRVKANASSTTTTSEYHPWNWQSSKNLDHLP